MGGARTDVSDCRGALPRVSDSDSDAHRLERQLSFILEIDRLKGVLRQSRLLDDSRRENSGEHSWHVAAIAPILAEYGPEPLDLARVVRMLLVHDVVEIDAGDVFVYDVAEQAGEVAERERAAAERIFGLLPADQAAEYRALWDEFEALESAEARFARAMDRLMPMLHNLRGSNSSWLRHGVRLDQVEQRNAIVREVAPRLWAWILPQLEAAVAAGRLLARAVE